MFGTGIVLAVSDGTRMRTGGGVKGKEANEVGSQWANGLVRFAGRPNLVSAQVPLHSVFTLLTTSQRHAAELFWLPRGVTLKFRKYYIHFIKLAYTLILSLLMCVY